MRSVGGARPAGAAEMPRGRASALIPHAAAHPRERTVQVLGPKVETNFAGLEVETLQ